MTRSIRSLAVLAVALAAAMLAAPAMAEPNFRMPTSARIDLVRDLPNEYPFERDGQYLDLGYLYSTERVNGADVARTGQGFVLYHDDLYIKLDPEKLSAVTLALGEDPTTDYIPPVATRDSQVARDGDGAPVAGQPAPYRSPARRGSASGLGIIAAPGRIRQYLVRHRPRRAGYGDRRFAPAIGIGDRDRTGIVDRGGDEQLVVLAGAEDETLGLTGVQPDRLDADAVGWWRRRVVLRDRRGGQQREGEEQQAHGVSPAPTRARNAQGVEGFSGMG